MIMRLTMTMLITMVTVRNTVVGPMPPTRRREKEAQIGFSCNLCGTEFIGDVKLKSQNVSNWNYYYIFNYYIVKLKKAKWPSNGDSACAKVHFTFLCRNPAEISVLCGFFKTRFILQKYVFSQFWFVLSLQKQQQRSRWWNIEMKNDEQFGDISLHFSARHPQKEIFHADRALPEIFAYCIKKLHICQKYAISLDHLTGPFWS